MAVNRVTKTRSSATVPVARELEQLDDVLLRQGDGEAHDLGLIVERLGWTPEQRLNANTSFLRLYAELRPEGPLIRE